METVKGGSISIELNKISEENCRFYISVPVCELRAVIVATNEVLDYHFGDGVMLVSFLVAGVLLLGSMAGIYFIALFIKRFFGWIYEKRKKMFHERGFTACPECGRSFSENPHPILLSLFGLEGNLSPRNLLERLNPLNKIRELREGLKYLSGQKHPLENLTCCRTCGEPNDETQPQEEELTRPREESKNRSS
ncbi:MAG: hypothetical protein CMI31_10775 [Opitutae bacterium]|nr:hypothetical protein [Opitutae bacterium]